MEHPNFASYVPSSYPNTMDLPDSHQPFSLPAHSSATTDSRQHSFDDNSCFNITPREILNIPVSRVAQSSFDPWLVDMPGPASPGSSRLSMSPSQGVATPSSGGFYSPPYPEQLQLPTYQLLEQPQPSRPCSTSHPNYVNSADNWQRDYAESDIWGTQSSVAQPWVPNSYDGYAPPNMVSSHVHGSNGALPPFTHASQNQFPVSEVVQSGSNVADESSPFGGNSSEDADSSDEDSDWEEEGSDYSQTEASSSKPKVRLPRPRIATWSVPVNRIQHSETRGYVCDDPRCDGAFVRPEHLRRHIRSKHTDEKNFICKIAGCKREFSRGDNLRDHYWTHLHRGGRAGKNKKMTLPELKLILGPREKKLVRKLRQKLNRYFENQKLKERLKKQRVAQAAYPIQSEL